MSGRRLSRELELQPQTWEQFDAIQQTLGHEDREETLCTLIELGVKAIAVTTPDNRQVRLVGGDRKKVGEPCKSCGYQPTVQNRETAVKLGVVREKPPPPPSL